MKLRRTLIMALSCTCLAFAADKYSPVAGVWRAQMDSLPALTMTISDEGGDLAGGALEGDASEGFDATGVNFGDFADGDGWHGQSACT